jgi:hypothetical protein
MTSNALYTSKLTLNSAHQMKPGSLAKARIINNSNECGPHTLLALRIMAFHPNLHNNILLPIMDTNIAQLCRTWIPWGQFN